MCFCECKINLAEAAHQWKTSGGKTRPRSCNLLLTVMTQEVSIKQTRSCMVHQRKTHHNSWARMVHPSSQRSQSTWKDDKNIFHKLLNRPGIITVEAQGRVHSQPILYELDAPHTGWSHQSHQRAKNPTKHPGLMALQLRYSSTVATHWHYACINCSQSWGSCRTTARPQRCIKQDHLQEQGRQERLQQLPWHVTSTSCRKMPCKDHPSYAWCPTSHDNILPES